MKILGKHFKTLKPIIVETKAGKIKSIRPWNGKEKPDLGKKSLLLSPGLIDIQFNGMLGMDFTTDVFTPAQVQKIEETQLAHGVTAIFPTIITSSGDSIMRQVKNISETMLDRPLFPLLAVEGPYISHEDGPRGAHDLKSVKDPDFKEFEGWFKASGGRLKLFTLAPERKGAVDFIQKAVKLGVFVAIGHTNANDEEIDAAIKAGANLSTHLGNGTHQMIQRHRNYIYTQMADDRLSAGVISDGDHLSPVILKIIRRVKGAGKLIITSDASKLAGSPPGDYVTSYGLEVVIRESGRIDLKNGMGLFGSGHFLDRCVQIYYQWGIGDFTEALTLATEAPARFFKLADRGVLEAGRRADLVLWSVDENKRSLEISAVVHGGVAVGH